MLRPAINEVTLNEASAARRTAARSATAQPATGNTAAKRTTAAQPAITPVPGSKTRLSITEEPFQPRVQNFNRRVGHTSQYGHQNSNQNGHTAGRLKFSYSDFAKQLASAPGTIGAIAPSSASLARKVVQQTNLNTAKTVVELGPGTGVFTEQIIRNLSADALFFSIELNQAFVAATKDRCPSARVYHDAASSLPQWLEKNNRSHADCIVSSLPWTLFDDVAQDEILMAIKESLAPGGVFVSIIYLGAQWRTRGRYFIRSLHEHFPTVTNTPTVWQNLPPSQIYRCTNTALIQTAG